MCISFREKIFFFCFSFPFRIRASFDKQPFFDTVNCWCLMGIAWEILENPDASCRIFFVFFFLFIVFFFFSPPIHYRIVSVRWSDSDCIFVVVSGGGAGGAFIVTNHHIKHNFPVYWWLLLTNNFHFFLSNGKRHQNINVGFKFLIFRLDQQKNHFYMYIQCIGRRV